MQEFISDIPMRYLAEIGIGSYRQFTCSDRALNERDQHCDQPVSLGLIGRSTELCPQVFYLGLREGKA